MKEWYQISAEEVKKKMETSEHGLTTEEAAKRLAQYGENVLAEGKKKSVFAVFFGQFADLLVGILIVAAAISACSGNPESTFVILVVIVLNALLGTIQYVKAEKSLESLKDLTSPNAKVLRSGVKVEIPAKEVVPGDLLLLEAGDLISPCRRLMVIASEDVGLAYPQAVSVVKACVDSANMLGLPEARIPLAQAAIFLATAPKSNGAILAIDSAMKDLRQGKGGEVPAFLRDSHYGGAEKLGHGQGYRYAHDYPRHYVPQQYLPDELKDRVYYHYGDNKTEQAAKRYWDEIKGKP